MSRKPYIKIVYPDASGVAMMLTEAMIRRTSGKRVVETTSTDKCEDDAGTLFSGVDACRTETSVELTLNLIPAAMDYALETLIRPNLTADKRKRILGDDASGDNLFSRAQAAQAPGQALDGDSSADVPSAEQEAATQSGEQEEKIEIGKMEAVDLRRIITDMQDDMVNHRGDHIEIAHRTFDAICEAAHMTKHDFAVDTGEDEEESDTWLTAMLATLIHLASNSKASKKNRARDIAFDFLSREEIGIPDSAWTTCAAIDKALEEAYKIAGAINKADPGQADADELFDRLLHEMDPDEYPMKENVQLDKADETDKTDEIEPGLLNDLDDGKEGEK
jgi:hypothetical protein